MHMEATPRAVSGETNWTGWFTIDHPIHDLLPVDMDDRFLVWVPGVGDTWPGEWHVAWWNPDQERIDGEWRHIEESDDNRGLNATEPTHWRFGPRGP